MGLHHPPAPLSRKLLTATSCGGALPEYLDMSCATSCSISRADHGLAHRSNEPGRSPSPTERTEQGHHSLQPSPPSFHQSRSQNSPSQIARGSWFRYQVHDILLRLNCMFPDRVGTAVIPLPLDIDALTRVPTRATKPWTGRPPQHPRRLQRRTATRTPAVCLTTAQMMLR